MRAQAAWNVMTHIARTARPTSSSTRSRISAAALLVNVMARISSARAWRVRSRYAIRWVSTRVLPEPAPARMSSGPSPCVTASRWGGVRPSSRASIAARGGAGDEPLGEAGGIVADGSGPSGSSVRVMPEPMSLPDEVRSACARVAAQARHVRVIEAAIEPYAATLDSESPPAPDLDGTLEERAAFSLTLNAINFGSGWFPTLRKVAGKSGFWTV